MLSSIHVADLPLYIRLSEGYATWDDVHIVHLLRSNSVWEGCLYGPTNALLFLVGIVPYCVMTIVHGDVSGGPVEAWLVYLTLGMWVMCVVDWYRAVVGLKLDRKL